MNYKIFCTQILMAALAGFPFLVIAGEELLGKSEINSRFGQLKVVRTGDEQQLSIGKNLIPIKDHLVQIDGRWQIDEKDVFLISMASGGNACPATYAFVVLERRVASVSESFGNCSDLPNVQRLGNRVLVKFGRMSSDNPAVVVEFDDGATFEGKKILKVIRVVF